MNKHQRASIQRKRIKHYHEPGDFHELTFSCYQRRPLLTNDAWRHLLAPSLNEALEFCRFELAAFVFMPEHVHLLVLPIDAEPDIGLFLARVKQPFSRLIKKLLESSNSPLLQQLTIRKRLEKLCFHFRQEGAGYDRNLHSVEAVESSIEYIHENPIKRGLCEKAINWKWSSARNYRGTPPKQQDSQLPLVHGIRPEALVKRERRRQVSFVSGP